MLGLNLPAELARPLTSPTPDLADPDLADPADPADPLVPVATKAGIRGTMRHGKNATYIRRNHA